MGEGREMGGETAGRHTAVVRSFRTVRAQRLRRFRRGVAVAAVVVVVRSSFPASLVSLVVSRTYVSSPVFSLSLSLLLPPCADASSSSRPAFLSCVPSNFGAFPHEDIYTERSAEEGRVAAGVASFLYTARTRRISAIATIVIVVTGRTPAHRYEVSVIHLTAIHRASERGGVALRLGK